MKLKIRRGNSKFIDDTIREKKIPPRLSSQLCAVINPIIMRQLCRGVIYLRLKSHSCQHFLSLHRCYCIGIMAQRAACSIHCRTGVSRRVALLDRGIASVVIYTRLLCILLERSFMDSDSCVIRRCVYIQI